MFPAFGLYSHIQANRRRSIALLLGLFFLVYAVVFAGALAFRGMGEGQFDTLAVNLRGAYGDMLYAAPVATIAVLAWIFIAYFGHQKLIDAVTGAHEISRQDDPRLYRMLENLCISRGMTTPKLKIMETDALNAFASGLDEKQYTVTLTRGLVERLEDDEIEAVIAHELTHIRNEDVRMMVIAVIIAGVVSFTGELLFRSLRYGGRMRLLTGGVGRGGGRGGGRAGGGAAIALLVAAAIVLIAWLLSLVIRFALSRSREYLADAGAVELTKRPDAMISALLKISGRAEMQKTPSSIMEMCIENPRTGFTALLATHPSIEDRVAALERHAGGRRPPPEKLTLRPSAAELLAQEKAAQEKAAQEKAGDGAQQGGRNTPPFPPTPWSGLPGMPGSGSGGDSGGNAAPTPWSGNSPWGKN